MFHFRRRPLAFFVFFLFIFHFRETRINHFRSPSRCRFLLVVVACLFVIPVYDKCDFEKTCQKMNTSSLFIYLLYFIYLI